MNSTSNTKKYELVQIDSRYTHPLLKTVSLYCIQKVNYIMNDSDFKCANTYSISLIILYTCICI